jgi:1-hydroxycarotenoid 3,4-desaturase
VIFNGDHAALAKGLLGAEAEHSVPASKPAKRSLSAMTWSMSASTNGFPLIRHNVFFSQDYASEFSDIFQRGQLPATPTVYVCAQDRDEHNAHQGLQKERLFCLVNAPAKGDSYQFSDDDIEQCRQRMFSLFEHCGFHVEHANDDCIVTTPSEFEQLFPATGGALYGKASHGWLASFQRPGSVSRVAGLYLAGGSVHPGAGVPMAAVSGRLAAEKLLHDSANR